MFFDFAPCERAIARAYSTNIKPIMRLSKRFAFRSFVFICLFWLSSHHLINWHQNRLLGHMHAAAAVAAANRSRSFFSLSFFFFLFKLKEATSRSCNTKLDDSKRLNNKMNYCVLFLVERRLFVEICMIAHKIHRHRSAHDVFINWFGCRVVAIK